MPGAGPQDGDVVVGHRRVPGLDGPGGEEGSAGGDVEVGLGAVPSA